MCSGSEAGSCLRLIESAHLGRAELLHELLLGVEARREVPQLHLVLQQPLPPPVCVVEREFFIDNLLVRIHFIIVMIRWTGLAPWEFERGEGGEERSCSLTSFCSSPFLHLCVL